tara:strand:- start:25 stop:588 length:564 start_codon:yes stop_codon:yes gene_type:complete
MNTKRVHGLSGLVKSKSSRGKISPLKSSHESEGDSWWDKAKKSVHTGLSVAGLAFPGADLINAGLYALEGDFKSAASAGLASIPIIGDTYAAGKLAAKAGKGVIDIAKTATKAGTKTRSVKTGVEKTVRGATNIPKDLARGKFKDAATNIGSVDYWRGTGEDIKSLAGLGGDKKKKPNIIYIKAPEF